jgi:hypothetical protein
MEIFSDEIHGRRASGGRQSGEEICKFRHNRALSYLIAGVIYTNPLL